MHKNLLLSLMLISVFSCEKKENYENTILNPASENTIINTVENSNVIGNVPTFMDLELKGYKTPDTNLKDFYGDIVFINFWGSWCPPCRMEMPSIQSLYEDYGDKVKFVMIAYEKQQGNHIEFIDENPYTFPVYEAISPMDSKLKPQGFPTTIVLDRQGNILFKDIGAKDWNSDDFRKTLDKLIND